MNLSTGLFIVDKTDLVVPDTIPIVLRRTYRPDPVVQTFGIGMTHSYQIFLIGDRVSYQWMEVVEPDGAKVRFLRTSPGTGLNDAELEHTTSGTRYYGARMVRVPGRPGWDLTFRDGGAWEFQDGNPGPWLTAIQDRWGNRLTITRQVGSDPAGIPHLYRITRITSPNGRWVEFTYVNPTGSVLVAQVRDYTGRTVSYTYDTTLPRLAQVVDAGGGVTQYAWQPSGDRMTTIRDARGIVYLTNEYDAAGRVVRQTQADGSTYQLAYTLDVNGQIIQTDVTDPRGQGRRVTFDANHYTASDTRAVGTPLAQTTTFTRDASNRVTAVTDGLGRQTAYSYDGQGNVLTVTRLAGTPGAVTTTYTYEATFSQVTSVTDPLGHTTTLAYDGQGNLTAATDPTGRPTTRTYNGAGQPLTVTTGAGTTTLGYELGELARVTDPAGHTTTRFTDAVGRLVALTNPLGQRTRYAYNAVNRSTGGRGSSTRSAARRRSATTRPATCSA